MQGAEMVDDAPRERTQGRARRLFFWGAATAVIVLDQATKALVRAWLQPGEAWPSHDWPVRIRYVTNTGAAFGIFQEQTAFLMVMALVGLAAIYIYYRNPPFDHLAATVAMGMMLGGAAGNLIDRIRLGRVTDFIDLPPWPAFNIADSSITIGVAVILIGYVFLAPKTHPPGRADP